jgi:hypothetical protein
MDSKLKNDKGTVQSFVGTMFLVLAGPIIWSIHLLVIYGAHAVLCSQSVSGRGAEAVVGAATLIGLGVLGLIAARSPARAFGGKDQTQHFLRTTMLLLALLSAFAVAWAGASIFFLPACLPLR